MIIIIINKKNTMEEAGIEPATCRMQSDHSTPELHPRNEFMLINTLL